MLAGVQDPSLRSVLVIFGALPLHVPPVAALDASHHPAAAETGSANGDTFGFPNSASSLTGVITVGSWIWGKSTTMPGGGLSLTPSLVVTTTAPISALARLLGLGTRAAGAVAGQAPGLATLRFASLLSAGIKQSRKPSGSTAIPLVSVSFTLLAVLSPVVILIT